MKFISRLMTTEVTTYTHTPKYITLSTFKFTVGKFSALLYCCNRNVINSTRRKTLVLKCQPPIYRLAINAIYSQLSIHHLLSLHHDWLSISKEQLHCSNFLLIAYKMKPPLDGMYMHSKYFKIKLLHRQFHTPCIFDTYQSVPDKKCQTALIQDDQCLNLCFTELRE